MITSLKKASVRTFAVLLIFTLLTGCSSSKNPSDNGQDQEDSQKSADGTVYENTDYGFEFTLPDSWSGYTIVDGSWTGEPMEGTDSDSSGDITGPMISIRHPLWTSDDPRQDIPIMIFTTDQWNSLQKEEFHIGAAPINPKELGHNSKYYFALPARYNFAFPTGYEEVETILENDPLKPLEK